MSRASRAEDIRDKWHDVTSPDSGTRSILADLREVCAIAECLEQEVSHLRDMHFRAIGLVEKATDLATKLCRVATEPSYAVQDRP